MLRRAPNHGGAERAFALGAEPRARLIPVLRELSIALVPFSLAGRGFLTGSAKRAEEYPEGDYRRTNDPRLQGENIDSNKRLTQREREVAERLGATASQVALAWLLARGDDIVPIPGTKRRTFLEENLARRHRAHGASTQRARRAHPRERSALLRGADGDRRSLKVAPSASTKMPAPKAVR